MTVNDINFVIGNINNPKEGSLGKAFTRLINLNSNSLAAYDKQHYFRKKDDSANITPDLAKNFEHKAAASNKGLSFKNFPSKKISQFSNNTKIVVFVHQPKMTSKKTHNIKNVFEAANNHNNVLFVTRPYFIKNGINGINTVLAFIGLPNVDSNDADTNKIIKRLTKKIKHKSEKLTAGLHKNNKNNKNNKNSKNNKVLKHKQAKFTRKQSNIIKKINHTLGLGHKKDTATQESSPELNIASIQKNQKALMQAVADKAAARKVAQKVA
jgi:hypothetical protein